MVSQILAKQEKEFKTRLPLPLADKLLDGLEEILEKQNLNKKPKFKTVFEKFKIKFADPIFKEDGYFNQNRKFTTWDHHPNQRDMQYQGEYTEQGRDGPGISVFENWSIEIAQYKNDARHGSVMTIWDSGDVWDEIYKDGVVLEGRIVTPFGSALNQRKTW